MLSEMEMELGGMECYHCCVPIVWGKIDLGFASDGWTRGKDKDWRDEDRSGVDHDGK